MVGPDGRHIRGFAHGAVVRTWSDDEMKHQTDVQPYLHLPELVERFYAVGEWTVVDHHRAHATGAYEASPFRSALVVSFDGGGNDGAFLAYYAARGKLTKLATLDYNFGEAYTNIAEILPEVAGTRAALDFFCNATRAAGDARAARDGGVEFFDKPEDLRELKGRLGFAGKLMGFAAAGTVRDELLLDLYDWFEESAASQGHLPRVYGAELQRVACADGSPEALRDVAATAQLMFERFVVDIVGQLLAHVGGAAAVDGVVLTGGCALNVLANQAVRDALGVELFVPPSPNDGGLGPGGAWALAPPSRTVVHHQYAGFRLWDLDALPGAAAARGAVSLEALGGVDFLAKLLNSDAAASGRKPIIAIVRGRQEYGPRALGHRSLVAVPDTDEVRARMNRLKFREWYRPVAPMIADDDLEAAFGADVRSPYMSLAPRLTDATARAFPALAHLDGTARHQSVGPADEPWVHALLLAVKALTGLGALINTSFNTRGKPICNTVAAALAMLDDLDDLDFVLVEDWLFAKPGRDVAAYF